MSSILARSLIRKSAFGQRFATRGGDLHHLGPGDSLPGKRRAPLQNGIRFVGFFSMAFIVPALGIAFQQWKAKQ